MADEHLSVNEEQLALFKEHVELQREELSEQREKNRADEALETQRIKAEEGFHARNLEHADKVLVAQSTDREQIRTFWSENLKRAINVLILLIVVISIIAGISIFRGEADVVFESLKTVATHLLALLAGLGADRAWIHRKKAGISSSQDSE